MLNSEEEKRKGIKVKVERESQVVRMEDEIKLCIFLYRYNLLSVFSIYKKFRNDLLWLVLIRNDLLWLVLLIWACGLRILICCPCFGASLVRERGERKVISAFVQCSWESDMIQTALK